MFYTERERVWFVVLSDCKGYLDKLLDSPQVNINVELTIYNVDGSHLSSEDSSLIWIYMASLLITLFMMNLSYWRLNRLKKEDLRYD